MAPPQDPISQELPDFDDLIPAAATIGNFPNFEQPGVYHDFNAAVQRLENEHLYGPVAASGSGPLRPAPNPRHTSAEDTNGHEDVKAQADTSQSIQTSVEAPDGSNETHSLGSSSRLGPDALNPLLQRISPFRPSPATYREFGFDQATPSTQDTPMTGAGDEDPNDDPGENAEYRTGVEDLFDQGLARPRTGSEASETTIRTRAARDRLAVLEAQHGIFLDFAEDLADARHENQELTQTTANLRQSNQDLVAENARLRERLDTLSQQILEAHRFLMRLADENADYGGFLTRRVANAGNNNRQEAMLMLDRHIQAQEQQEEGQLQQQQQQLQLQQRQQPQQLNRPQLLGPHAPPMLRQAFGPLFGFGNNNSLL